MNRRSATADSPRKSKLEQKNAIKEKPFMIAHLQTARQETCCCRIIHFREEDALCVVAKCIVPI